MKRIVLILLISMCATPMVAQTIKGTLTDSETGESIPYANVVLDGTRYGVATDLNGFYLINKMPEGSYTLRVRFVGYVEFTEPITIKKGQTIVRNIVLKPEAKTLSDVTVTDNRAACLEPVNQLSGYVWGNRWGYYAEMRDSKSIFHFDQMPFYTNHITNTFP